MCKSIWNEDVFIVKKCWKRLWSIGVVVLIKFNAIIFRLNQLGGNFIFAENDLGHIFELSSRKIEIVPRNLYDRYMYRFKKHSKMET